MTGASTDIWEVMSTARTIRRFDGRPVDDSTLARCIEAATWAPSGANAQEWRFVVLRSPAQRAVVAEAASRALKVIEVAYSMTRPAADDVSRRARDNRATYELHRSRRRIHVGALRAEAATDGLGHATRWIDLPGHAELPAGRPRTRTRRLPDQLGLVRRGGTAAVGRRHPDDRIVPGHIVVGWPKGRHGPVRRRPWQDAVNLDRWGERAPDIEAAGVASSNP